MNTSGFLLEKSLAFSKTIFKNLGEILFDATGKKLQMFENKVLHQNPKISLHPL